MPAGPGPYMPPGDALVQIHPSRPPTPTQGIALCYISCILACKPSAAVRLHTCDVILIPLMRAALSCWAACRQDATVPVKCIRQGLTTRFLMVVIMVTAHHICAA